MIGVGGCSTADKPSTQHCSVEYNSSQSQSHNCSVGFDWNGVHVGQNDAICNMTGVGGCSTADRSGIEHSPPECYRSHWGSHKCSLGLGGDPEPPCGVAIQVPQCYSATHVESEALMCPCRCVCARPETARWLLFCASHLLISASA